METRVKVVELNGRKVFECDGVRFNDEIKATRLGVEEGTVLFFRAGAMLFQGRIGVRKIWPDAPRTTIAFIGFTGERITELDYIDEFAVGQLEPGDEIVITTEQEIDLVRLVIEHYLCASWQPFKHRLFNLFQYPSNWREDLAPARAVFEAKISAVREALASGELELLEFFWRNPNPVAKETCFNIDIVERNGQKYFCYRNVLFARFPIIQAFWTAEMGRYSSDCTADVFYESLADVLCTFHIGTVGRSEVVEFHCWTPAARQFLPYEASGTLLAKNFETSHHFCLKIPFEIDLLEALAEHVALEAIPEIARLEALEPSFEEQSFFAGQGYYSLIHDMQRSFQLAARDKLVELVLTGEVDTLEFKGRD